MNDEIIKNLVQLYANANVRIEQLERENAALLDWVKEEGKRNNVCTYGILKEVCEDCRCGRRKETQP